MNWEKLGLIIKPDESIWWLSHYGGPTFVDIYDDEIKLYFVGRDKNGISRIGYAILDKSDLRKVLHISKDPVFDIGKIGYFDENGVSYPWIVRNGNELLLYYVGWTQGGIGGFWTHIGLAKYNIEIKKFERLLNVPIIDRINTEPICSGSCCVIKEGKLWKMWYTSFDRWEKNNKPLHYYHIKYATSLDGINWKREGIVAIDFNDEKEYTIAKPMVIYENGIYKMWYSYRGKYYKIGYAESYDGIKWSRMDKKVGINVSSKGWDSEMIEYGYVFDYDNKRYMMYNGNGFGKSGIGLAVMTNKVGK